MGASACEVVDRSFALESEIADSRRHVAPDALEGAQHLPVITHDVTDHHVVEAHAPVVSQLLRVLYAKTNKLVEKNIAATFTTGS